MSFSSPAFLFWFLPAFFLIYYAAAPRWRNLLLLAGSLTFYAAGGGGGFALLLVGSTVFHYAAARILAGKEEPARRRILLVTLGADLLLFAFFRYLCPKLGLSAMQPIGISFYLFQCAAYAIDVSRGTVAAEVNLLDFTAFVTAFPQLTMGPICRYADLRPALKHRVLYRFNLEQGFQTFVIGLSFKVVLADNLAALWASIERIGFDSISTALAWLGVFGYSFQLYFDFAGYSLMAVGLGQMLGLPIPHNFNFPYVARSVSEFFRRWHISLGLWFRDYVYIPLGGSRNGTARTLLSLLAVWLFTGLWHGLSLHFALWGLVLFALIALERFCLHSVLERRCVLSHCYVIFVIPLTWMLFKLPDLRSIGQYFTTLFCFFKKSEFVYGDDFLKHFSTYWWVFALSVLCSLPVTERFYERHREKAFFYIPLLLLFWYDVFMIARTGSNPFLYGRF